MKMRRCFADPHYWKNPALRRSREKQSKMPQTKLSPERGRTLCASLRSRNACPHATSSRDIRRATLYGNLQGDMPRPRMRTHTLCKPAKSKCMSTCHKSHRKNHFIIRKLTGKIPRPRTRTHFARACGVETEVHMSHDIRRATLDGNFQEKCCGPDWAQNADTLCASLCSRNACPHVTRDTFYGNLQIIEGSLEVKLPTIWTDEKQSRAEAERRERLEERRVEEKEPEERRCRCAKRSESRETLFFQ